MYAIFLGKGHFEGADRVKQSIRDTPNNRAQLESWG